MSDNKTFTLRLTEQELENVKRRSQELGISRNDYIRGLIGKEERADELALILSELREIKATLKK